MVALKLKKSPRHAAADSDSNEDIASSSSSLSEPVKSKKKLIAKKKARKLQTVKQTVCKSPWLFCKTPGHSDSCVTCAFSANGRYLATAGQDRKVKVFPVKHMLESGSANKFQTVPLGFEHATSLSFSHDGQLLACALTNNRIQIWRIKKDDVPKMRIEFETVHKNKIISLHFSTNGDTPYLAVGCQELVSLYSAKGEMVKKFSTKQGEFYKFDVSADGTLLCLPNHSMNAKVFNVVFKRGDFDHVTHVMTVGKHTGSVNGCTFGAYPRGFETLVTCSNDSTIKIWNTGVNYRQGADLQLKDSIDFESPLGLVCVSPCNKFIVASSASTGKLFIFTIEGDLIERIEDAHDSVITSLVFSPTGKHFATTDSYAKNARVWSLPVSM
eukprot:TRINITY_DN777879_c0_g1_i1.p1 TRINITY_DN777879_c0_g1~~TRINITY_DN777879_c0_g1_i1.p1  ORF type:complete len:418 (-),score=130.61 TRINITY_DN777879_c0_g1_i1:197-1348(-)